MIQTNSRKFTYVRSCSTVKLRDYRDKQKKWISFANIIIGAPFSGMQQSTLDRLTVFGKVYTHTNGVKVVDGAHGQISFIQLPEDQQLLFVSTNTSLDSLLLIHKDNHDKLHLSHYQKDDNSQWKGSNFDLDADQVRIFDDTFGFTITNDSTKKWYLLSGLSVPDLQSSMSQKDAMKAIKSAAAKVPIDKKGDVITAVADTESDSVGVVTEKSISVFKKGLSQISKSFDQLTDLETAELISNDIKNHGAKLAVSHNKLGLFTNRSLYIFTGYNQPRVEPQLKYAGDFDELYTNGTNVIAARKGKQLYLTGSKGLRSMNQLPYERRAEYFDLFVTLDREDLQHVQFITSTKGHILKFEFPDEVRFGFTDDETARDFAKYLASNSLPYNLDTAAFTKILKSPQIFNDLKLCD